MTTFNAESDAGFPSRRLAIAKLRLDWELLKFVLRGRKAGFNPAQPRVPAGNRDGGQWTHEGGDALTEKIMAIAKQMRLAANPASYQECLRLCSPLLERPKPYGWSDINKYDFHRCMSDCMRRKPL